MLRYYDETREHLSDGEGELPGIFWKNGEEARDVTTGSDTPLLTV